MKLQKYIIPVCITGKLFAQDDSDLCPEPGFGFTHSTYSSMCFNSTSKATDRNSNFNLTNKKHIITETQYGFGIGMFMWMPLNDAITFKPKIEGVFSNSCIKQSPCVFATSFDFNISHGFIVALTKPNENGIIYMARNMTCYLTSKQPYLLVGPKISLKKYDKGYIQKGFENELSIGFFLGYGINYIFQGKNFAPEICYTISSTSQNEINNSRKVTHSITLAVNFF